MFGVAGRARIDAARPTVSTLMGACCIRLSAAPEIKAGRLVPLLEDWRAGSAVFSLNYPSRRQVPLPLQAFIEFLRETCG
jgi:DNA-binding transcriptional LysR family regulator